MIFVVTASWNACVGSNLWYLALMDTARGAERDWLLATKLLGYNE